jgi:hypothetical protein
LRVIAPRNRTSVFGHASAPGLDSGCISACTAITPAITQVGVKKAKTAIESSPNASKSFAAHPCTRPSLQNTCFLPTPPNKMIMLKSKTMDKIKTNQIDTDDLKRILVECVEILYKKDFHLIQHNLSERSISHRLALYLTEKFVKLNLDVDCEYNGDIENAKDNYRKRIEMLTSDLKKIGHKVNNSEELQSLAVYPDIIIHKRGENKQNSLIIEIKKEFKGRTIDEKFDRKKLSNYTSDYHGNHLKYLLGVYIEFDTLTSEKSYRIDFYKNGEIVGKIVYP